MPTKEIRGRRALIKAVGATQTEADFQADILKLARQLGWLAYHTHDSRRSPEGFPDLVLCRPPEVLFIELKTATGRLTNGQREWFKALVESNRVTAAVFRPADWDEIVEVLK